VCAPLDARTGEAFPRAKRVGERSPGLGECSAVTAEVSRACELTVAEAGFGLLPSVRGRFTDGRPYVPRAGRNQAPPTSPGPRSAAALAPVAHTAVFTRLAWSRRLGARTPSPVCVGRPCARGRRTRGENPQLPWPLSEVTHAPTHCDAGETSAGEDAEVSPAAARGRATWCATSREFP